MTLVSRLETVINSMTAPAPHAATHATAGSDPVSPTSIGAADEVHEHQVTLLSASSMGSSYTIDLGGKDFVVFDGILTAASCAISFTGFPTSPGDVLVRLHQDATGGRAVTFPGLPGSAWEDGNQPAIQSAANALTRFVVSSLDGSALEGSHGQRVRTYVLGLDGALAVAAGKKRIYFERDARVVKVRASVGDAPVSTAAVFDVNKNGTTLYTTQANRPSIPAGSNTVVATLPDILTFAPGDYMTVDVDTASSAGYLTLQVATIQP